MAISGLDHFRQVFAQRRFTSAKGKPVGISADRRKGLVVLFNGEIIIWTLPDIARFTT